jgi:hypothetical protein
MLAGKIDQLVPLSDANSFHCTRLLRLRLLRLRLRRGGCAAKPPMLNLRDPVHGLKLGPQVP